MNRNSTIRVAKTKVLISFAVTAKLICAFVIAYAKCWLSHDVAHISFQDILAVFKMPQTGIFSGRPVHGGMLTIHPKSALNSVGKRVIK